jgi:RND family efflux transporter MFP subunit
MRILTVIGIPILAIVIVVVMISLKPEPPKKERIELGQIVDVIELKPMTAKFEIKSQGTVRPRTSTALSAEVSGTIIEISPKFIAGGLFQKNEILMRIDPTNYTVDLQQAEALVKQRQIEFNGAAKLHEKGYRTEVELASAAAALATAKAGMVRAQKNLERTYIKLPYEGIVRSKESDLGQFVTIGTRLGATFSTTVAEIRLPLTDEDLMFLDLPDITDKTPTNNVIGPSVILEATQKGEQNYWNAKIIRSEGVVDESNRVTFAVAQITDPYRLYTDGSALPIGTFVAANIQGISVPNVYQVPRRVVRGSDQLIFVDNENNLDIRQVSIVNSDSNYVYVNKGVYEGDRVVITPIQAPVNGMTVRISGEKRSDSSANRATSSSSER